jgi:Flp pilus assembly protein TadG
MSQQKGNKPEGLRNIDELPGSRSGSVAAEFGLVVPLMITMMFGIMHFGLVFFSYSAMQSSARDVARQVAVNTLSAASATTEAKARVPGWMRDSMTVSLVQTAPGNPSLNVIRMTASVPASKASPIPLLGISDYTLSTQVEMKQELPYVEPPK